MVNYRADRGKGDNLISYKFAFWSVVYRGNMERYGERAIAVSSKHKSGVTCLLGALFSRVFGHI
jgi:hypothetical protein